MKRVILDTNIYGEIIEKQDTNLVLNNIPKCGIIIYSCDVIRNELRKISKGELALVSGKRKKLRSTILSLYHNLARKDLVVTKETLELAEMYYSIYSKLGGIKAREKIINDFIIVAVASRNNLDIVYSQDRQSMLSFLSARAYDFVNTVKKLRSPQFRSYEEFRHDISLLSP